MEGGILGAGVVGTSVIRVACPLTMISTLRSTHFVSAAQIGCDRPLQTSFILWSDLGISTMSPHCKGISFEQSPASNAVSRLRFKMLVRPLASRRLIFTLAKSGNRKLD